MHGLLNSAFCSDCDWQGPRHSRLEGNRECSACKRDALRPDIVLFGEARRHMRQIEVDLKECYLFLAIGTSGTDYPASGFAEIAKAHGAQTNLFDIDLAERRSHFDCCEIGLASRKVRSWVDSII
jgi:NAD-dependent deacetylase